jgi:hypothetical protein
MPRSPTALRASTRGGQRDAAASVLAASSPLSDAAMRYIDERLEPYRRWYDRNSKRARRMYLSMRSFAVLGGCVTPVLVNLQALFGSASLDHPPLRIAITGVSLAVGITISLEGVFHFQERWRAFRTTEEILAHERTVFTTHTGPYHNLSGEDAFSLFVNRVENIIISDGAMNLQMLTATREPAHKTAGEAAVAGSPSGS